MRKQHRLLSSLAFPDIQMVYGSVAIAVVMQAAASCLAQSLPYWSGPDLNPLEPLGGVPLAANVTLTNIVRGTPAIGTDNTFPELDFHNGQFLVSWQLYNVTNSTGPSPILYSQSYDGLNWTETDGTNILFPAIQLNTGAMQTFNSAPPLHINGTTYAAASPDQFYLYPAMYQSLVLMRRVITPGFGKFGPIFWATDALPPGYENASAALGILTLAQMDAATQADIATLSNWNQLPCDPPSTGDLSCPACLNGCQEWNWSNYSGAASLYHVPNSTTDVILYRDTNAEFELTASVRQTPTAWWVGPTVITIPDGGSDFDAGNLPNGHAFLLANTMPNVVRDPLFLSTSADGWNFNNTVALTSCTLPIFTSAEQPYGCLPRYDFGKKQPGAQFPQTAVLTTPGYQGLWAVFTVNNEDIWILHAPFASLE
jgi:hypothetical protein